MYKVVKNLLMMGLMEVSRADTIEEAKRLAVLAYPEIGKLRDGGYGNVKLQLMDKNNRVLENFTLDQSCMENI